MHHAPPALVSLRMLRSILILLCLSLPVAAWPFSLQKKLGPDYHLQTGDIVFQATGGQQCEAIRAATHSPFSHCGVVFESDGRLYVLEAINPVVSTPLAKFRKRSLPGTFHARRLKGIDKHLTPLVMANAIAWSESNLGKSYDALFLWNDNELYCSELVWKIFHESAGLELVQPRRFDSFDLSSEIVQGLIVERFGSRDKFPGAEPVVAPSDLAKSPLLVEVPRRHGKK